MDRPVVRFVSYFPAPAAVGGVPHDVISAADEREGGECVERRESRGEPIIPV